MKLTDKAEEAKQQGRRLGALQRQCARASQSQKREEKGGKDRGFQLREIIVIPVFNPFLLFWPEKLVPESRLVHHVFPPYMIGNKLVIYSKTFKNQN